MKILLAIDGSAPSEAAAAEVGRRPWPPHSEVRVITVDPPLEADLLRTGSQTVFDEFLLRQRATAHRHLDAAVALVKQNAPELPVAPVFREGRPKEVILDEAERWGADLIVVGSHGYGALRRLFLGSVSLAIATNAPCSVEIVRIPGSSAETTPTRT